MDFQKIAFDKVNQLSHFDQLYAADQQLFSSLLPYPATMEGIAASIEGRKNKDVNRELLVEIMTNQYKTNGIDGRDELIKSLSDKNTFTIVTAHQPYLFGGPLYFILKILSAVKLAEQCKTAFPDYNFVPVFYIGGEDHDIDESNNVTVFNKKVVWNTDQTGPVGRMTTQDITASLEEIITILGNSENALKLAEDLRACYAVGNDINDAITCFIHHVLADFQLLVLNADDLKAKQSFKYIIRDEVLNGVAEALVTSQQEELKKMGLKPQAFVRPINFFYLSDEGRNRIINKDGNFIINNTEIKFTVSEMERELDDHPERFSPNVIIRPIYEEFLLPSVAFVGGGGELAYWIDRKPLFEYFDVHMPVLVRRDSMMIVDKGSMKKLGKLQLKIQDLFKDAHDLKTYFLNMHAESAISFNEENQELAELIKKMQEKVASIDPTLSGFVGSETSSFFKTIEHIEARVKKSLSSKHDIELQQLHTLQQKFFPANSLQERNESFMSFYIKMGNSLFEKIYNASNPLDISFKVIEE